MDRKFLTALAQYPQGRTRRQVLTLAAYADSGPVSKCFARLRTEGWMVDVGELMTITEDGLAALGSYEVLPTGAPLIWHWLAKLPRMPSKFLSVLVEADGEEVARRDLLDRAGYADSGPVSKSIALLRRLELLRDGNGGMALNRETFSS